MIIGMMNTGMIHTGVMATGFIILMGTTACIMCGGIRGGGITIGGDAIGATISPGISTDVDSTLCGMRTTAGGSGRDMDAGFVIGCPTPTMKSDTTLSNTVLRCRQSHPVRSTYHIRNRRS
jgi:hypothetical protein